MSSNDYSNNNAIVLKAGGERTKVSPEEAKIILERFRSELAVAEKIAGDRCNVAVEVVVRELDLSCRSWEAPVLESFRDFFVRSVAPSVEVLNLDDIIASLPTADGLATFEFFVQVFAGGGSTTSAAAAKHRLLRHLNLNDNAIGTRGIEILRPLLSVSSLHSIDLTNTGLAEADCKTLLEIATSTGGSAGGDGDVSSSSLLLCERLRRLSLGRNQVGAGGAAHIGKLLARCPRLEHLEYAGARPLVRGTRDLCRGLAEAVTTLSPEAGSHLQHLNLKDCHLNGGDDDDDPVLELCSALSKSPNLVHLNVSDCVLTAAGAKRVLKALEASNCPLEFLDLGANELETDGAEALAEYLPKVVPSSLRELHLETNELTDEGVCTIVQALAATNNSTTTEESSKLVVLHLGENEISKEGASCLLEYTLPSSLRTLHLTDNTDIPRQLAVKLRSKYPAVIMDDLDDLEEDPDLAAGDDDGDKDVDALAEQLGAERIS